MTRRFPKSWLFVALLLSLSASIAAQTPHPRLLFTASEIPGLQAKFAQAGTPASTAFNLCASSASLLSGSLPSTSGQTAWGVQAGIRRMVEVAFRYAVMGDVNAGNNAKSVLLNAVTRLTPVSTTSYQTATYACAVALTYDWIYPLLSSSDKALVVAHLEQWVTALRSGTNGYVYHSQFSAATDNFSFAWCTGIAFSLMAIQGDSSYPNLVSLIQTNLDMIRQGWRDAISPDGSIDESYGYANYGNLYALNAGIAAQNCGYGDIISGTNVLKSARWIGASLLGSGFIWTGDSSPAHKGTRIDPIIYYTAKRSNDAEALWLLERLATVEPLSDSLPSFAFSPFVNKALHYPTNLAPLAPRLLSSFYCDNLNEGVPSSNTFQAYAQVGQGGHALFHNSVSSSQVQLGGLYLIRDEWMNHAHEDDGQFCLVSEGQPHYVDLGYAGSSFSLAQSTDHNIVLVQNETYPFNGAANNYYAPPSPNGRFLGRREASLFSESFDYIRGTHANMWMMQEASRTVALVKDATRPYFILIDRVRKDSSVRTYEQVFQSPVSAQGAGTVSNPMTTTVNGTTVRATYLSPSTVTVVPGAIASASIGSYAKNRVTASGVGVTFVSVHGKNAVSAVQPLQQALTNTQGGTLVWPQSTDKVLVRTGTGTMGDAATRADANFGWLRFAGSALSAWAVGEGQSLVHQGKTLLLATTPVTVCVKDGVIEVTLPPGSPSLAGMILRAPFQVTRLSLDGQAVLFQQDGERVTFGQPPTAPPSLNDRAYSFLNGFLWDAVLEGPAVIIGSELRSSGGTAGVRVRGGQSLPARPISLGTAVRFLAGANGVEASLILESGLGLADLVRVDFEPVAPSTFRAIVRRGGQVLATLNVPSSIEGNGGRLVLEWNPANGQIQIADAAGVQLGNVTIPAFSGVYDARVTVTEQGAVDDIAFFDSEEDGITPQGVAVYCLPSGHIGYAAHAGQMLFYEDVGIHYNGVKVDPSFALMWFANGGVHEEFATPSILAGTLPPLGLKQLGFESTHVSSHTTQGTTLGVSLITAYGAELFGRWVY